MHFKHIIYFISAIILFPASAFGGGHDDCNMCHESVAEKNYTLIEYSDSEIINPATRKPYGKADAYCVYCHDIKSKSSHPVGVVPNPDKVNVPKEALGFKGQEHEISCQSCHNPHPENRNYKYLRWPPENAWNLAQFCTNCHTSKGTPQREGLTRISKG